MQAIVIERNGDPEVLVARETPVPRPAAGEALVRVHAAGVNFMDVYARQGAKPYARDLPFTPGAEGAGVVEAVGDGTTDVAVGDRVAWAHVPASYAEYVVAPTERLVALPPTLTFADGAAAMLQGMTAHYLATSTYPLQPGRVAVVHAGAGGVGLLLTQIARMHGATVIATVSTEAKAALSRAAGAHHVLLSGREDTAARVREITGGRGADVIYDSVGKATFEGSLAALARRGMLVSYGAASGPVPPLDVRTLTAHGSLFLTRPSLGDYIATREELLERANAVLGAVVDGSLRLRVEHAYPLAEARRAHEELQARATTGKLVLVP